MIINCVRLHAAYALISKLARRVFSHFRDGSKHDIELLITFLIIFFLKENVQDLVAQFISDKNNEKKIDCFSSNQKERKINSVEGWRKIAIFSLWLLITKLTLIKLKILMMTK